MLKTGAFSVQKHPKNAQFVLKKTVVLVVAVLQTIDDGPVSVRKMFADLMPSARFQKRFGERKTRRRVSRPDRPIALAFFQNSKTGAGFLRLKNARFRVGQRLVDQLRPVGQMAPNDGQIPFFGLFLLKNAAQTARSLRVFSKKKDARSRPIEPVRRKNVRPAELVAQHLDGKNAVFAHRRPMHEQRGRLVDGDEKIVFEKDREHRRAQNLGDKKISVRRFAERPSGVSFDATG